MMDKMQEEDFSSEVNASPSLCLMLLVRSLYLNTSTRTQNGQSVLEKVGQVYGFANSHNAEISYRWSLLVIKNNLLSGLPQGSW